MDTTLERGIENEMTCPACSACQSWSEQCRRCKCDLSMLRQFHNACDDERTRCLWALQCGHPHRALQHARRFARLAGHAKADQLLGVCNLLCGHWPEALAAYRQTLIG